MSTLPDSGVVVTPQVLMDAETRLNVLVLGPWVIGAFADVLLQGILIPMFITYFQSYKEDKMILKVAVGGLALLTTLKSAQAIALVWIQNIVYFGDQEGALLLSYTTWWQSGNPLMVAFIGIYVQTYFLNRLRLISKSLVMVIPIALILFFGFVSIVVATIYIGKQVNAPIALWFACHLSAVFAGDLLMTLSIAFYLIKTKKSVLPQTVGVIKALIRLTLMTAAPAAICAMINLILSQAFEGTDNLMSTAFNMALPKLYALSMMYTLNSRRSIRLGSRSGRSNEYPSSGSAHQLAVRRTGNRTGDVERGALTGMSVGGITVHTETQNHIDVRDMFDQDIKKGSGKTGNPEATFGETYYEAK